MFLTMMLKVILYDYLIMLILIHFVCFAVLYAPSLGAMGLDETLPLPRSSVYHLVGKTVNDPPPGFHPEDESYFVSSICYV